MVLLNMMHLFCFFNNLQNRHDPETGKSGIEYIVAYLCKLLSKLPKNISDKHSQENDVIGDIILGLIMNVSLWF